MTTVERRRTQSERSAATRERLLDATIECLIDLGYASTSTTEIVQRAGVSRGAQVHHFPTKADLVRGAIAHLARRQGAQFRKEYERLERSGDRVSAAIDLLWSAYAGPLFVATVELIVAARTDSSLQPALDSLQDDFADGFTEIYAEMFGRQTLERQDWQDVAALTTAMMHGLALGGMASAYRDHQPRLLETWKRLVRPVFETGRGRA